MVVLRSIVYYPVYNNLICIGMLARALKLDPSMADAWYNVGALYDMADQPEDAQQAYLKARENGLADRFARAGTFTIEVLFLFYIITILSNLISI